MGRDLHHAKWVSRVVIVWGGAGEMQLYVEVK
jgi:hypothetical protein